MAIEYATLGGGCFWCLDSVFRQVVGVQSVISGYSAGHTENPTYQDICTGSTGHAEVIQVAFDNKIVSFDTLLTLFFNMHNPTTLNQQGADKGTQYRSIILGQDETQIAQAKTAIAALNESGVWGGKAVTEVQALDVFFPAEELHQNYFQNNPGNGYCQAVITPKLAKFKQHFSQLLKGESE